MQGRQLILTRRVNYYINTLRGRLKDRYNRQSQSQAVSHVHYSKGVNRNPFQCLEWVWPIHKELLLKPLYTGTEAQFNC